MEPFSFVVNRLRDEYVKLRDSSNLYENCFPVEVVKERMEGPDTMIYWLDDGQPTYRYLRLMDIPGTLSGDILRLRRNLPPTTGRYCEINGDIVHNLDTTPPPVPDADEDDSEDVSGGLELLPVVEVDHSKHFTKQSKYRSEIRNLLKCQGGTCPGQPLSTNIVRLLGRSSSGEIVLEKLTVYPLVLSQPQFCSISVYKRWILDLISGLTCLHELGIVHRDLRIDNILFRPDGNDGYSLVICDIESHWGIRAAPELNCYGTLDAGWTEKSDIYDLGSCIKSIIYVNNPLTEQVEWPVPAPFDNIVEVCLQKKPQDRPSLDELSIMVKNISMAN